MSIEKIPYIDIRASIIKDEYNKIVIEDVTCNETDVLNIVGKAQYNQKIHGLNFNTNKWTPQMKDKIYYKHTGYIGNLKSMNLETMMNKSPERVLTRSVRGMLPKTKLGNVMIKKLKVFAGPEHDHGSQKPQTLEI